MTIRLMRSVCAGTVSAAVIAMCSSCSTASEGPITLTLVAYDSFTFSDDAFRDFTESTGIRVDVAIGGDAGEIAAKAALTAGNPEGDVLWGVDNTLLTRLTDASVFDPYLSASDAIPDRLVEFGEGVVTPVDFGFVCVNYDVEAVRALGIEPPRTFADLISPEYAGLLAIPSAATSSPGLAFLLATYAAFDDGWADYWQALIDNDVAIARDWTDAYYSRFSRHGGDRPLVVSYSTSPPAEVLFSDPPLAPGSPAPTGVATETCFEQIEFAGILRGTDHPDEAALLVDFLVSQTFQEMLPESLFVYPAHQRAHLPDSFEKYAVPVEKPWTMTSRDIDRLRVDVLDQWSRLTGS